MNKKISVIVPIYNDFDKLRAFIIQLKKLQGIENTQVIFSDGYGDDSSAQLVKNSGFTYTLSERGRGKQLNSGYRISDGEILLFLHVDSQLEKDVLLKIQKAVTEDKTVFGCLRIYFDSDTVLMKICGYMSRHRVKHRKIVFGDQAMFFERKFFEKIGGFKDINIMEDYEISMRIKQLGEENYLPRQIDSKIITSSRKYYSGNRWYNKGFLSFIGVLKVMYEMQIFQSQYRKGVSSEEIDRQYYKK